MSNHDLGAPKPVKEPNPRRMLQVAVALFGAFALVMAILAAGIYFDGKDRDAAIEETRQVVEELRVALEQFEAARATARVSSCDQAVEFQVAHNDLVRSFQALLLQIRAGTDRPETQAFIDEQVAEFDGNIVRVRDCSPEGLQAFADGTGGYLP